MGLGIWFSLNGSLLFPYSSIDPKKTISLHSGLKLLTKFLVISKVFLIWLIFSSDLFILNFVAEARCKIISGLQILR